MRRHEKFNWNISILVLAAVVYIIARSLFIENYTVEDNTLRVGITICDSGDSFLQEITGELTNEMDAMADEYGFRLVYDIADAGHSSDRQRQQVLYMLQQNCDIICVNLVSRIQAAAIVEMAKDAEVPVIFFHRKPEDEDMEEWVQTYYVGGDEIKASRMQAQMLLQMMRVPGNTVDKNNDGLLQYVLVEEEQFHSNTIYRTNAVLEELGQEEQLEQLALVTAGWSRTMAQKKMADIIKQYGDRIEAVLCNSDDMALGVLAAYRLMDIDSGRPVILGINGEKEAVEAVGKEEISGTVQLDSINQGKEISNIIKQLFLEKDTAGTALKERTFLVPHEAVWASK